MGGRGVLRWVATLGLVLATACESNGISVERADDDAPVPVDPVELEEAATTAGRRFLEGYVDDHGRVVRRDQGGDTVSEGQAYGMLIAVALGDRAAFDEIWQWTRNNLQRDDGLLAWRWSNGQIVDAMPATDADVDVAHALARAADRFEEPEYATAASELAANIIEHDVIAGELGPVAVAGPWAKEGRWVNPSYGDPTGFAALAALTGAPAWELLDDAARRIADQSATSTDLPPDWAVLTPDAIEPRGAPSSGGAPRHGYDAARTAIRFAVDCDETGREIAADLVDEYEAAAGRHSRPPAVIDLSGAAIVDHGHPVMTVAHAASLHAAGDREAGAVALHEAAEQTGEAPTYYGDAWVALGRIWLTTDWLGGCRTP